MRYLGVDYGLRKIGLAFGDSETRFAVPGEVVEVVGAAPRGRPVELVKNIIQEEGIDEIVVGVPLGVSDHSSEQLELTRAFIADLKKVINLPVHEMDERYTSGEARRLQKEYGAQADEDALAAMLILQNYLDELVKH